jgi:predicted glycoside hydrolase/deacetylase ChbG (UPF0249 family)
MYENLAVAVDDMASKLSESATQMSNYIHNQATMYEKLRQSQNQAFEAQDLAVQTHDQMRRNVEAGGRATLSRFDELQEALQSQMQELEQFVETRRDQINEVHTTPKFLSKHELTLPGI